MEKNDVRYSAYTRLVHYELRPAMGCTEPIAVAYACARARALLGCLPERVELVVSGNIIKNVKSVVVPNTGGRRGLKTSAAVGVTAADESRELECLAQLTDADREAIDAYLQKDCIHIDVATSGRVFDLDVTVYAGEDSARVRIADAHTNIVHLSRNGEVLLDKPLIDAMDDPDEGLLTVEGIVDYADSVDLDDVREPLERQISYNTAISDEGLKNTYGASIGRVLLQGYGKDDVHIRAKARAAAGSDARMNGCEMPVIIVSGSGNQGITATMPLVEYAETYGVEQDRLLRALIVADLLTVHQKTGIGRLSAFCGAVNAACGAAAGIAYLMGGGLKEVSHTLVNALAIVSGMVCDGAKASCAAKIMAALEGGLMGYEMYRNGFQFYSGDGLVKKGVENTIDNIARLGKKGMSETDREILRMMIE